MVTPYKRVILKIKNVLKNTVNARHYHFSQIVTLHDDILLSVAQKDPAAEKQVERFSPRNRNDDPATRVDFFSENSEKRERKKKLQNRYDLVRGRIATTAGRLHGAQTDRRKNV